ncbi:MltG/YceG/YrrL family protein [Bacillus niameyensis]|uniref:endolytic transglycosylase MltG n=1 Tax=Bacillus niameyensis TaxID=1522308 RepID=UPI0007823892|nr:endolytic transglycosylase MltG [Bacillus niameyensis]
MDKRTTRAFASGLLLASLFLIGHNSLSKPSSTEKSEPSRVGYVEITKKEYEQIKSETKEWQTKYEKLASEKKTAKKADSASDEKTIQESFQLTISEGMTSKEISNELEEAGLIEDAENFNDYLADQDLQRYLQIGSFELKTGMTYKEIAEIIAKEK